MVFQQKGRICWNTAVTPRGPKFLRHFAATFAQPGVGRRILMAGVVPISGSIFPWTVKLNENPFTILPFRIEFTEFWCPNSNDKSRLRGPLAAGLAAPAHAENWLGTPGKMRFFRARIGCTRLRNTFETCCLLETAMTSKLCKETYSIISIGCGDFVMQRNLVWLRTIPTRWNSVPPGFCRNWGSMSFGASRRMNKSLKAKRRMWSRTASVRHVIRRIHPSLVGPVEPPNRSMECSRQYTVPICSFDEMFCYTAMKTDGNLFRPKTGGLSMTNMFKTYNNHQ